MCLAHTTPGLPRLKSLPTARSNASRLGPWKRRVLTTRGCTFNSRGGIRSTRRDNDNETERPAPPPPIMHDLLVPEGVSHIPQQRTCVQLSSNSIVRVPESAWGASTVRLDASFVESQVDLRPSPFDKHSTAEFRSVVQRLYVCAFLVELRQGRHKGKVRRMFPLTRLQDGATVLQNV